MEKFQPEGDCFVGNEAYAEFPPKQSPEGWNFSICTDNKPCKILFLAYLPFPFYILCYLRWNKSSIFVQDANVLKINRENGLFRVIIKVPFREPQCTCVLAPTLVTLMTSCLKMLLLPEIS